MRKRWELMPLGTSGLLLLSLVALGCSSPDSLTVGLVNCAEIRSGPVCVTDGKVSELWVVVHALPGTELSAEDEQGNLRVTCDDAAAQTDHCVARSGGNRLRVPLSAPQQLVRICARTPGRISSRRYEISVEPAAPPAAWLALAGRQWEDEANLPLAEQTLRQNLKRADLGPADRARGLSMLARILGEELRFQEAEPVFTEALQLDEQAGLLSDQAANVLYWSNVLQDLRSLFKLERLLAASQPLFTLVASLRPWLGVYRALSAQMMGDLDQALHHLNDADRWNQLSGSVKTKNIAAVFRASILAQLGRVREDVFIANAERQLVDDPCALGLLLRRRAQLRIEVLESELGEGVALDQRTKQRVHALWECWEPGIPAETDSILTRHDGKIRALLSRSQAVLMGEAFPAPPDSGPIAGTGQVKNCRVLRHLTLVTLTQARLALLMRRLGDAHTWLGQARAGLLAANVRPEQAPTFDVEWNRLAAHLARAERRFGDALAFINQLEQHSGDDVGAFEPRWMLHIGRAQALLGMGTARRKEALDALWAADRVLEEAGRSAPRLLGRGSLFGRFEWGSRLLLEELLQVDEAGVVQAPAGELAQALRFMRHVRTRALLELRRFDRLQELDSKKRSQWSDAEARFLAARQELERAQLAGEPMARLREREEKARQELARALEILGEEIPPAQRPPQRDELFLICHPLRQRWACLCAEPGRSVAETFEMDVLSDTGTSRRLASTLLERFRPQLLAMKGKTLTVFGYGSFRDVPLHLLNFEGQRLGQWLTVRYSLDQGLAPSSGGSQVIVAIDGKLEQAESKEERIQIADPLLAALSANPRWDLAHYEMGSHGGVPGRPKSASIAALRERIPHAGLLFIFSHADYLPAGGWINAIAFTPWSRLTAGDVLLMPRVPDRVVLIACNSGSASDLVGGQESLGIAQAFLLRGSQEVLSTTRAVTPQAGAVVVRMVASHLSAHPDGGLSAALEATISSLTSAGIENPTEGSNGITQTDSLQAQRVLQELDAFRVLSR